MKKDICRRGFTLVEVIGGVALIAVLGSAAAPKIIAAMEDARITAYVQQIDTLTIAAAKFHTDTGHWPRHIPTHPQRRYHQLTMNDLDGSSPIPGWQGPYVAQEPVNYLSEGSYQELFFSSDSGLDWACDVEGGGGSAKHLVIYRSDGISDKLAQKISDIIDGDGDITAGEKAWNKSGKVRRYQGAHSSILGVCLAGH